MRLACTFYDENLVKKKNNVDDGIGMFIPYLAQPKRYRHRDVDWQVMNEIALHRGSSPHLNTIDIYVDGQHLTEAVVSSSQQSAIQLTYLYPSLMAS